MYRVASLIVAGVVVVAGLVVYAEPPANPGDDPPMLKKKGAPDVDDGALKPPADDNDKDKKPDAPKPDAPKPDGDKGKPRPDPEEVLKDVAKSMHSAEEHLAKKELGDPTRQAQEDALKGLDSLIDLAQNPPDDPGDQGNKDNKDSKDNKDNKDNKQGKQGGKQGDSSSQPGASGSSGSKSGSMNRQGQRRQRTRNNQSQGGGKPDSGKQGSGEKQPGMEGDQPALAASGASTAGLIGSPLGQGPLLAASAAVSGRADQPRDPSASNGGGNGGGKPEADKSDDAIVKLITERWGELTPTLREEMKKYADLDDMKSMPEYQRRVDEFRKAAAQSQRKGN